MTVPLRVMPGKVLIQPDVEAQTVEQHESGLLLAKTLAAAVEGSDARESWYTGIVVAVHPQGVDFDVRPYVRRRLYDMLDHTSYFDMLDDVDRLIKDLDALPQHRDRGFRVGDVVTFTAQAGQEITIDGVTYLILAEGDILGVLEPQEELYA